MFQNYEEGSSKDLLIGITLTVLIFAVSIYLPIIGFIGSLMLPLPVLFYRLKLGRQNGLIIPVAAIILIVILLNGFPLDLLFFAELLILGFALGESIEKNISVEKTILLTCGIVLSAGVIGLLIYSSARHTNPYQLVSAYIGKNLQVTLALYENMGMPEENIRMISGSLDRIQYVLVRILPGLAVTAALMTAWINFLAVRYLYRRMNNPFPDYGTLNRWQVSDYLVWSVIGCGLILMLPVGPIKMIGLNGLIILMMVYFFQGIAIVSFFFEKRKFPPMLKALFYGIIALQQLIVLIVIGMGFFDMWLNFRKLETNNNHQ